MHTFYEIEKSLVVILYWNSKSHKWNPVRVVVRVEVPGDEEEDVDDPPDAEPTQGQQLAHGSSSLTQAESVKAEKSKKYGIEKSCYEVMVGVSHAGKAVPQKDSWARTFDTI